MKVIFLRRPEVHRRWREAPRWAQLR